MHIVSYADTRTRPKAKPRQTRRNAKLQLECEPLEDRRLLSAASTITFTFNFNFNLIANSIPSVVPFTATFTSTVSTGNASAGSAGGVSAANNASVSAIAQNTVAKPVSITPISPSVFSPNASNDGEEPVVYLFFTPQTVVHLGASTAPATTQRVRAMSIDQETPTTTGNLFGQSLDNTISGMADPTLVPASTTPESSLIDFIEPAEPAVANAAPQQPEIKAAPAPAEDAAPKPAPIQQQPQPNAAEAKEAELFSLRLDKALELMTAAPDLGPTPQDQAIATASDSSPKLVAAAAIAFGGYHLLFGRSERFRDGRFRTGSRRASPDGSRFQPSMN